MNIVVSLLIGGSIGWAASTVMGTGDRHGLLLDIAIGMTGAVIGIWLLSRLVDVGATGGTVAVSTSLLSFVGAVVLLAAAKLARVA